MSGDLQPGENIYGGREERRQEHPRAALHIPHPDNKVVRRLTHVEQLQKGDGCSEIHPELLLASILQHRILHLHRCRSAARLANASSVSGAPVCTSAPSVQDSPLWGGGERMGGGVLLTACLDPGQLGMQS